LSDINYEVGDEFEGSPSQLNRWVSPIWAIGGKVQFDGTRATIIYLPPTTGPEPSTEEYFESFTKQVEESQPPLPVVVEEVPVVKEPVKKEPVKVVEEAPVESEEEVPVKEEPVKKAPVQVVGEAPIQAFKASKGRPKKAVDPTESEVR
jgi:hypothetical protein